MILKPLSYLLCCPQIPLSGVQCLSAVLPEGAPSHETSASPAPGALPLPGGEGPGGGGGAQSQLEGTSHAVGGTDPTWIYSHANNPLLRPRRIELVSWDLCQGVIVSYVQSLLTDSLLNALWTQANGRKLAVLPRPRLTS